MGYRQTVTLCSLLSNYKLYITMSMKQCLPTHTVTCLHVIYTFVTGFTKTDQTVTFCVLRNTILKY